MKRTAPVNIRDVPGEIVGNRYEFPPLYGFNNSGKSMFWNQYIVLVSNEPGTLKINWRDDQIQAVPILSKYYISEDLPLIAMLYAERGYVGGKITRNVPTIVSLGKNIGKVNSTNSFTQALVDGNSSWHKKIDTGYSTQLACAPDANKLYFPMAAKKFGEVWDPSKVTYPVYSQPKLDGIRAIAVWDGGNLEMYSRKHKPLIGFDHHVRHLTNVLTGMPPRYLDGELYEHGKSLQAIGSVARNEQHSDKLLTYWIFDTFDIHDLKKPFADRLVYLNEMKSQLECDVDGYPLIRIIDTQTVHSRTELDNLYKNYRTDGYEGQMVKFNLPYETSCAREKRSSHVLKRKERQTEEFKIIDYEMAQKGAHAGAVLFKLQAGSGTFNAQPVGMTVEEMRQLFKLVDGNPAAYVGKMATVEFEEYSDAGIPKQPKFVAVRDYE